MAVMGVGNQTNTYASNKPSSGVAAANDLGKTTQDYLDGLKEKYPDVNITVADFKSEKQSDAYMYGSSGYNNVALSQGILSQMASDPEAAAKYEKIIAEMPENAKNTEKYAKDNNQVIYGSGVVIDKNGKVSYWMIGGDKEARENPGTLYKEKVQQQLAEKWEKKQEEVRKEKAAEQEKTVEKEKGLNLDISI